ncbi:MAG: DUF1080 domain-containing protein [Acidobacteria bacterium]|nr:DUF1080 domain-containing protein [Acidobacteriota bacterium]
MTVIALGTCIVTAPAAQTQWPGPRPSPEATKTVRALPQRDSLSGMRPLLALCAAVPVLLAQPNTLTPQEAAEGWVLLFDGESLFGWTPEGKAQWQVSEGTIASAGGDYGWLRHQAALGDFRLKLEYKTGDDGNSGIFLRSARVGQAHITGYELQIFNQHPQFPTGGVVGHFAGKKVSPAGGQWHAYDMEVNGDRLLVRLDGETVLDARDPKTKLGHIGLQYNRDKPIAFRNIKARPLNLSPLFNGRDLTGWTRVDTPRTKEPPIWSVEDGKLHVVKGAGQLETVALFDDFVLQLDIRANSSDPARHPNSGVFFRGDPNAFWTGYESQIRNEFKNGDPTQPVDFGTGAIYYHSPARRVVGRDNEFFTKTIVAQGRQISIWVNGYPVTSWEDPHPEGKNVGRKEARLGSGPISLQAHDPTTNLDFRNIRAVGLPR